MKSSSPLSDILPVVIPVPESFLPVEDEASVIALDDKIIEANRELDAAKADKPTYDIPSQYLMDK